MPDHLIKSSFPIQLTPIDFLNDFAARLDAIFGAKFGGLYLHGSIALDAFDPKSSDIDFAVLLHAPLDKDELLLRKLHRELCRESQWGKRLDGYYLVDGASTDRSTPTIFSGRYHYVLKGRMRRGIHFPVVARHLLHMNGTTVTGRRADEIFAAVTQEELLNEMRYNLDVYWRGRTKRPWLFFFDEMVDFSVTTLPRILFTIEKGTIISKQEALGFLDERFPEWRHLADGVLSKWTAGRSPLGRIRRMRATLDFVRTMIREGSAQDKG